MMEEAVRMPAVAGMFYPKRRDELLLTVMMHLNECEQVVTAKPKALVVPHAGYVFSGGVAAAAYKQLEDYKDGYDRIILLGAAHRAPVEGAALPSQGWFSTPAGTVRLDADYIKNIVAAGLAVIDDSAHRYEHSLEVQLPFIGQLLPDVPVVPVLFGHTALEQAVKLLHSLWGDDRTLIIVSTDLSHYLPVVAAERVDRRTRRKIALLDPSLEPDEACASTALNALLYVAQLKGLKTEILAHCHSGEHSGDNSRVVGYVAAALAPDAVGGNSLGTVLLRLARAAIASVWHKQQPLLFPELPALQENGATFVTLTKFGKLRGCIGSLQAWRALGEDVQKNAAAAAFGDPRFPRLEKEELNGICVEVSLLSEPEPLHFASEQDLLEQLRPGEDGLIISCNGRRGTFLPQVWEQLPEPADFLTQLKQKAGLTADFWDDGMEVWRYTVKKWKESDYGG